jgi:methylmalonyl-CoA mutase N-terminal domain/subunit
MPEDHALYQHSVPKHAVDPVYDTAAREWREAFANQVAEPREPRRNRSGIEIEPLYTPEHWSDRRYMEDLGFPGAAPWTRGIHAGMYHGRSWAARQLIGLGLPEDYRARLASLLEAGLTNISISPCNSFMRGFDADGVEPELLGTCGVVINTLDDLETCLEGIDLATTSLNLGDNAPFTLGAMLFALARRNGISWSKLAGTSNQSDYLSLFIANHMFYRLSLPGQRRMLVDHIRFTQEQAPAWNPISIVGQHMQQAGATPAQAMGFALCSAIQYAEDCMAAGMAPDSFLPRFSFFFDVSISFFEEIAKFRAGRRIWARIVRDRLGADDTRSMRFRFHAQTSGVDLTRQQPLNNIARVAVQAMAGIFGGLQSLHTDAYDEALSSPTGEAARIAVATQGILREEAGLTEVIDPLAGSYYVETLTNQMEAEIEAVIALIDAAGGMYAAAEAGLVQRMIGDSARAFQQDVETGRRTIVGVNRYTIPEEEDHLPAPLPRLAPEAVEAHIERLRAYRDRRDPEALARALNAIDAAAADPSRNLFAAMIEAADAGATHGEMCARARQVLGDGVPVIAP